MLLVAIFAGLLLHSYRSDAITSATHRQLQLKAEYLYRTLELAQVENYSLSYFQSIVRGIAENLAGENELTVPTDVLHAEIEDTLEYLRPPDFGVLIKLEHENGSWSQVVPSGVGWPGPKVVQFAFSGEATIMIAEAENRVIQVAAEVAIFEL
jgi:hypothetical protein